MKGGFADLRVPWRDWTRPDADLAALFRAWRAHFEARGWSWDYTATDLFVPERHAFRFTDAVQRPEPLYGWPPMFFANMAGKKDSDAKQDAKQ